MSRRQVRRVSIGEIIGHFRREAGLSQDELASRLKLPQQSVSVHEQPTAKPRWSTIEKILGAAGYEIFGETFLDEKGRADAAIVIRKLKGAAK
jgi:transcriptional regulator with XRE-family HTH domain